MTGAFGAAAALAAAAVVAPTASAAPAIDVPTPDGATVKEDDRPDSLATKRRELKQKAVELVATGQAEVETRAKGSSSSRVVEVAPGQWVEYETEEEAQLLTFLVEFGDQTDDRFPDAPAGPVHNAIPEPTTQDNSTYWTSDFSREHFLDMFFEGLDDQGGESFHGVYDEMSSGRFDLQGDVSDWVTVPYHQASYGQTESNVDMTRFIQDSADAWYADQVAQGKSPEEITEYLESFDVWDRYDLDGDGVYDEADGYIDHFQAIHAGPGEEAGAPESAIWSHRWSVNPNGWQDGDGPADYEPAGGVRIGDSDVWIRDYTTEPENGGLGVFAHEFGHDLGLPDYYDTAGGENGTGFWNLMSSGSWLGHGDGTIGTTPNHMGAHEKMFLGWLDYTSVDAGESATVDLGLSFHATKKSQAVVVNLPEGEEKIDVLPPFDGKYLYSGTGDDRTASAASPSFTVPADGQLTAKVNYQIEADWDYAYAEISTDGGATFTPLATNLSTDTDPNNQNLGHGITGTTDGAWVGLTADVSAYAGETAQVRFRHVNDAAYHETGLAVDDVAVGSALTASFEDDAAAWTLDGYTVVTDGSYTQTYSHYYVAENRQYAGYDATLATGPYNFGWQLTAPDTVEHYAYQDGLLVWYVNSLYGDNNTSQHPGGGQALPVDANAAALTWSDGTVARNRIQSYDATFSTQAAAPLSLHRETEGGMTTLVTDGAPANPVFDDTDPFAYYDDANPGGSVVVGGTGTTIEVKKVSKRGVMTVLVN
ncbi:immune inhibitor A [Isoptericola sp. S6320L]|uniref:M6 family metalloprotease domain-containing protein n=1 Tax=Isoptericola sp. S6320L TaxID=2926411 RepID=UPI001FF6EAA9|nr:M6 family metalloprotease domain-containing protein [Isoptericola sp. S6320L]MCK0116954.1 immune inhibitor A [Isoptericola sp. S6320L]